VNRVSYKKTSRALANVVILPGPWHSMSMGFMTRLPQTQGQYAILVLVNWFAKLTNMMLIVGTANAFETA